MVKAEVTLGGRAEEKRAQDHAGESSSCSKAKDRRLTRQGTEREVADCPAAEARDKPAGPSFPEDRSLPLGLVTSAKPEFAGVQIPGLARGCELCGKPASLGRL